MNNLRELIDWFPSGTAEGEKSILEEAFVYVDDFADIMAPPPGNPHLLIGNKGSGKSAVIDFAQRVLSQGGIPAITLTPTDFDTTTLNENSSTGDMNRIFYSVLMSSIAAKISETKGELLTGDKATLYNHAIEAGKMTPDFIGKMSRFLAEAAKSVVKLDFSSALKSLPKDIVPELEAALSRVLSKKSFYIFIDDTDQIANPERSGHLNRIWSLLLAVRRLTSSIPEVRAIVTLRSEVWERLKVDPAGQRDQTDHFNSLRITLRSTDKQVAAIIERRLSRAAGQLKRHGELYAPFFDGISARAPYSEDKKSWRDLIVVRSRQRPRDAIQLVNELAKKTLREKKSNLIDEDVFRSVIPSFSERVSQEFSKEFALDCPAISEILRSFSRLYFEGGAFTLTSEQAKEHFSKVLTMFSVKLYGITLSPARESDVFELWRFFYLNGLLNARVSDNERKLGYRHLDPEADLMLVSKPRWNDIQKALWEINPVFRDYLITIHQQESLQTGLAIKRPNRRNRGGK